MADKTYREWNPHEYVNEPVSPAEILPEDDLVFFLLELVPQLNLSRFYVHYEAETRGAPPFEPAMMVTLLLYSYCVGVFSSRKISAACERNIAFMTIVGRDRPDFRTISEFRRIHLEAFQDIFLEVLMIAGEMGLVKLGNLSLDGSKVRANASRHKAMSYGYMKKEVERLRAEIAELTSQAEKTDAEQDAALGSRRGDELPDEIKRREQRLAKIEEAMGRLEAEAKDKADAKRQERADKQAEREAEGKKPRQQKPIDEEPADKAQTNFTDPDAKIMKTSNKGFDYCYNGQVMVDEEAQIIVAADVTSAANDKQQAIPLATQTLENLEAAGIETPKNDDGTDAKIPMSADSGYFSETNVDGLDAEGFDPFIATGRQKHNQPQTVETSSEPAPNNPADASGSKPELTPTEKMAEKLRTPDGKERYAKRKHIVEPVFGQMKQARGFRQFLLRGLDKVKGEWNLMCLTHNLLKIWRYQSAPT
jgi:transposase